MLNSDTFHINSFRVDSSKLMIGDFRLNAEYYEENTALRINEDIVFKPLSQFASVFFPGIFKRVLADNEKFGIGFLTTSEMMLLEPIPEKYLSVDYTYNLDIYRVHENSLLVSRSGTIGNTIYVNNDLVKYAITEDALRVMPFNRNDIGFLYFYLTSEYGNAIITGKRSGAVIDHVYEDDLLNIPIPILDTNIIDYLYELYRIIKDKREKANDLIREARSYVLKYNDLPSLSVKFLETTDSNTQSQGRIVSTNEISSDYRLDAHFYNPLIKEAEDNIVKYCFKYEKLSEVTTDIRMSPLFVRNFVENNYGVKYIAGKHISQIRKSYKYISSSETIDLEEHLLFKGWTLMTCAGTIGKIGYVNDELAGAAAQDLMRIVPDENIIDGGYLNAWLSTEYGHALIHRHKYGAVVDRISPEQTGEILIPIIDPAKQKEIGDMVRQAYDWRDEAIRLEDEAQEILTKALTTGN